MGLALTKSMQSSTALLAVCTLALLLVGCAAPEPYVYRYIPGKTAQVTPDGYAVAPPNAPAEVHAAVAAGNRIAGLPYKFGGGHTRGIDSAYDCSGAVSYLLSAAGQLDGSTTSRGFRKYGDRGEGDWISVYARKGHVFAVVAGLRFDTGYAGQIKGPQWTTRSRPTDGYVIRHPDEL